MSSTVTALRIFNENLNSSTIYKIKSFPCTIGRSFKNDIVLEDSSVSALHAVLDYGKNGFFIVDKSSTNGLLFNGKIVEQIDLEDNITFYIGELLIEFIQENEKLETTKVVKKERKEVKKIREDKKISKISFAALSVLIPLLMLLRMYLDSPLNSELIGRKFTEFFKVSIGFGLIIAVLSLISKVHLKKYRYINFLYFFMIYIVIFQVWALVSPFLFFHINSRELSKIVKIGFNYTTLLLFIFGLISKIALKTQLKKIFVVVLIIYSGLLIIFYTFKDMGRDDSGYEMNTTYSYPLFTYDRESENIKGLLDKIDESTKEIDSLREEELKKREDR